MDLYQACSQPRNGALHCWIRPTVLILPGGNEPRMADFLAQGPEALGKPCASPMAAPEDGAGWKGNTMYNLDRFLKAQQIDFDRALSEIQNAYKQSHWMWYIFPQIAGLGQSQMSRYYAIASLEEAKAYLNNPVLGSSLRTLCRELLKLETNCAVLIFGSIDARKLQSSMTLFSEAAEENQLFLDVLEKFYDGRRDTATLEILKAQNAKG